MKAYVDATRTERVLTVGQQVLLSTKNIRPKYGKKKLMPSQVGPFTVIRQVNDVAYKLDLPKTWKLHSVFHVSLLVPYNDSGRYRPPPVELLGEDLEYEVEAILLHKAVRGHTGDSGGGGSEDDNPKNYKYYIKWEGYGPEHCSWEPYKNLKNCKAMLDAYWRRQSPDSDSQPPRKRSKY
jgi:hypothetical protein